ncbi:protein of unknown function [Pararobbsia alpina]|uniref:BTAD domain-containing putative transcriptional regulator n=1 Tax=Pararobbsia alpina TaxID=621374 RepID=UPI0039A67CE5
MRPSETSHSNLTVGVLGQTLVMHDGVRCELPASRKTRGLLAYLALAQKRCLRDELCDLLWQGAADPRGELRWSLSKLKLVVGPWLDISSDGVAFVTDGLTVDAIAMRALAESPLDKPGIHEALALWRGLPLADVEVAGQPAFQAWIASERDALSGLRSTLLRAAVDLDWARPEEALSAARRLVAAEPWSEWGHARVVQLLERCGRVDEATAYAASTRRSLSRELGIKDIQLATAPPPRIEVIAGSHRTPQQSGPRPGVMLEPLKLAPRGDETAAIGLRVAASLSTSLWRQGSFVVVDGERASRLLSDRADIDFAIRGAIVRERHAAQVSLRCIDVRRGSVMWADQIELERSPVSHLQEWVEKTAEAMGAAMRAASDEADDDRRLHNRIAKAGRLTASLEPAANQMALTLLKDILDENPDEPCALALAAWCHAQRVVYNWSSNIDGDRAESRYYAASATRGGIHDPKCLTTIATARMLVGDPNGAEVLLSRSLQLDRQIPETRIRSGWLANFAEDPGAAVRHFRAAIKLAPLDQPPFNALAGLGAAHFIEGNHGEAIRRMEQALALNPKALWIHRNLVPAYAAAGERRKAEDGARTLVDHYPRLTVGDITGAILFSSPVLARIAAGLREAGVPG